MKAVQTTLCYLMQGDRLLMLHRVKKENDLNHDKWIGVGGHFEAGETPEECMRREVFEETGLTVEEFSYRAVVRFVSDQYPTEDMHLFTVTKWSGEQIVCDEGDLEWIKKADLLALPMWEGDKIFLNRIFTDTPFFHLCLTYQGDRLVDAKDESFCF